MKRLLSLFMATLSLPAAVMVPKAPTGLQNLPAELKREILNINAQYGNRPNIDALAKGLLNLSHTNRIVRAQINSLPNILVILNSLPKSAAVYLVEKLIQTPVIQDNMLTILQALPIHGAKYLEKIAAKTPGMQRPEVKKWLGTITLKSGRPFFDAVAQNNWPKAIAVLEDPLTDINWQESFSYTPLMWLAFYRRPEVATLLLKEGANINAKTYSSGETALLIASGQANTKMVDLLLAAGANVDDKDVNKRTSLMIASEDGNPEIVKLLLDAGADLSARNKKGRTSLDLARKNAPHLPHRANEFNAIIKLLEDAEKAQKEKAARKQLHLNSL